MKPVVYPRRLEVSKHKNETNDDQPADLFASTPAPRSLAKHYFDEQVQTPSEVDGSLYSASAYSAYSAAVS